MSDVPAGETYQSLYRRFRPQRFAEVRGQEHVTRALRNAVREGKVAHAYLFSGPRGTGKTSTARILAMALNCEQPTDGEPDGVCPSCVEIRRGASLDVHELDAASNRRLDEMRELLSRVALGTRGRWKVYIVDEVHQLTPDASSALLKTLEEPPGHVVFVLATTDPQKVLQTIRSRTQHFEFRLLGADVLGGLLRDVNDRADLGLAPEAIDVVVRRGQGSARDALSALDQVAALGDVDDDTALVGGIVDAVAERDAGRVLAAVAEAVAAGRDPRRLGNDLVAQLRNGFLATQARSLVLLPDDDAAEAERQARQLGLPALVRALELLGEAAVDMRDAVDPRVTLEVALVRLAAPAADTGHDGLLRRVEHLEREVARLAASGGQPASAPEQLGARRAGAGPFAAPGAALSPAGAGPGPAAAAGAPGGPPDGRSPQRVVPPRRPALGAPPPQPGRARPAPPLPGSDEAPAASSPVQRRAESPAGDRPQADEGRPARPALGALRGGKAAAADHRPAPADVPRPADGSPPVDVPRPADPPPPAAGSAGSVDLPSRDALTKAWGDHVLPRLPPKVKVYLSAGRWIDGGGGLAVLALPDRGLLEQVLPLKGEVEAALAAHFGRSLPFELAVDDGGSPLTAPAAATGAPAPTGIQSAAPPAGAGGRPPADDEDYDLGDLADAGAEVTSPEQRLFEAFPGAEEVTP